MSSNFDEAVAKYRSFLQSNGYSPNTVWITAYDILVSDRPLLYVRMPISIENENSARQLFEFGIREQKGIWFRTICDSFDTTFIHAWVPRDEDEAQRYLMPRDLKMSASTGLSRRPARIVRSRALWWLLRLRYRKLQKDKEQLFCEE